MTSILLYFPMRVFGATHPVATMTMTVLSIITVALFFYMIVYAAKIRSVFVCVISLLLFGLSASMHIYRFDTETAVPAQLFLLLSSIFFQIP